MDSNTDMDDEVEIILQQDSVEVTEPLVADYVLPTATASTLGGVKIGDNISINSNGVISVPVATNSSKGVVQAGTGIAIDANGVISATGEYTLPQATKTTLGGVYVDDELNNSSVNPVQNGVVSTTISTLSGTVSSLGSSVSSMSSTVEGLDTTVGNLNTIVSNMASTVSDNTSGISGLSSTVSGLANDVGTLNTSVGNLSNTVNTLSGQVSQLQQITNESIAYNDLDSTGWTDGFVKLQGIGNMLMLYINLEGSSTIASGSSLTLHTLDADYTPSFDAYGVANVIDGTIEVKVDSSTGDIILINNDSTSVNIGKVIAGLTLIYGTVQ